MQPAELGRYRIVDVIGRGGMGVVPPPHDPQIDRPVAIKTIALDALSDHERAIFESRFRAEMRSAGRLQHHNIAALYDTGRDGGTAYIVMERVAGHDLKRRLAAGERFTLPQVIDIALQLLAALEFAHRHHVIHRDVKPANVMLQPDGTVKLCDFGVARLADSDATRTQGMIVGSLRYASPEQISGRAIDERTDVFSTGVLIFELLTGRLPFGGDSDVEVLHRIAHEPAPSLRSLAPALPAEVDAAVQRALSKDPQDRFASAAEFARALGGSSITTTDTPPASPATTRPGAVADSRGDAATVIGTTTGTGTAALAADAGSSRRGALAAAIAIGTVAVAAGAWWGLRPSSPTTTAIAPAALPVTATAPAPSPSPASTTSPVPASTTSAVPASTTSAVPASTTSPVPASTAAARAESAAPATANAASVAAAPALAPAPPATVRPTPSPPAAASPSPPKPAPVLVAGGSWHGKLACGASLTPGHTGRGSEAFEADLAIDLAGQRLTWTRGSSNYGESAAGTLDAQGRFAVDGKGAFKDGSSQWLVSARGEYQARTRGFEGRAQLKRPSDGFVTRECRFVAERGAAVAQPPKPAAPAKAAVVVPAGEWRGVLSCGELMNSPKSDRQAPFEARVKVRTAGNRFEWVRESATSKETVSGSFDASGRLSASGEGVPKDSQRSAWRVVAAGQYTAEPRGIEAKVTLARLKDGTTTRECRLRVSL